MPTSGTTGISMGANPLVSVSIVAKSWTERSKKIGKREEPRVHSLLQLISQIWTHTAVHEPNRAKCSLMMTCSHLPHEAVANGISE